MKKLIIFVMLAVAYIAATSARETLKIETIPDQSCLVSGSPQDVVIKIDLTAATDVKVKRTPLNLAVVIDRSGSMQGAKIEKARQAAMMAVDRLSKGDVFSLVAFDTTVDVLVPAQPVEDKELIKQQIERIRPRGNTALYAGIESAARELKLYLADKRINRILLLSDGIANVGPSKPGQLRELGRSLAERGISVSTIGVGDDYNEDLMSDLAEASDANYYYVKDVETLPSIFAKEMGALVSVAARQIRIEVTCPDGVHPIGFIGRNENFNDQRAVVELNNLTAGENRYLLLRCRAEEGKKMSAREIARVKVTYADELHDGRQCTASDTAHVAFSPDITIARASANATVIAQRELMLNALKIDEALVAADAGQLANAAKRLSAQADWLSSQAHSAAQSQVDSEVQNLRRRASELEAGRYNSSTRKGLQNDSWNTRNSKNND